MTNKRRRGFADPDLKTSKKQARKDDAKFVAAKFGNFASEARKRGGGDDGDFDGDASSSSDDDDARAALGRKPPKQRAFAFKNFARRVAEVDVDVHRAAGELRAAPLHGSSCFFQEALAQWAELCCGADFSAFSAAPTRPRRPRNHRDDDDAGSMTKKSYAHGHFACSALGQGMGPKAARRPRFGCGLAASGQ